MIPWRRPARPRAHATDPGTRIKSDGSKVVLVGVDDSVSSWRAAAYAAGLARREDALLIMIYIRPVVAVTGPYGSVDVSPDHSHSILSHITESLRHTAGRGVPRWQFVVSRGDPSTGLIHAADRYQADVVVLGTSRRRWGRFSSSVSCTLVKTARWPVTVVP
ncbi:universal stress protein [Nocardia veterana]|uniref:universal stress protein n=1 Tax=Nocardia veterana TaxID=132249 RepID=UPI0035712079